MTAQERACAELNELVRKIKKIEDFVKSEKIRGLSWNAAALLQTQYYLMKAYAEVLENRIVIWRD